MISAFGFEKFASVRTLVNFYLARLTNADFRLGSRCATAGLWIKQTEYVFQAVAVLTQQSTQLASNSISFFGRHHPSWFQVQQAERRVVVRVYETQPDRTFDAPKLAGVGRSWLEPLSAALRISTPGCCRRYWARTTTRHLKN